MALEAACTGVKKDIKLKRYILNPDMSLIIPQPASTGEGMRRAVRCPHCFVKCEATDLKIHLEACVSAVALVHRQGPTVVQAPLGKHKHSMTTAFCKINILSRSVGVVHFVGSPGHYTVQLLMKLKDWCSKKWYCTCSPGEEGHTIVAGKGKDGLLVADYGHSTNITLGELTTSLMVCDNLKNLSEIGFERGLKLPDEVDYHLRFGVNHVFAAGRVATHGPPPPVAEVLRTPPCTTTCKTCRTHGCESCRKCPIRRLSGCSSLTHVTCYQPDKTLEPRFLTLSFHITRCRSLPGYLVLVASHSVVNARTHTHVHVITCGFEYIRFLAELSHEVVARVPSLYACCTPRVRA